MCVGIVNAEETPGHRLVQNVKEISVQFQWGDLVSATHQLNPNEELDVGIATYLLAYHKLRSGFDQDALKTFADAPSRAQMDILQLASHPLHDTINKLISLKEVIENANPNDGVFYELYKRFFSSSYTNQIDFYLWCGVQTSFDLEAYTPNYRSHGKLDSINCGPYDPLSSLELKNYASGAFSAVEAQQTILKLEDLYENALSVYEELDILAELGSIAAVSVEIDTFVKSSARYSDIINAYNITDPNIIKMEMMFKQGLRALWPDMPSPTSDLGLPDNSLEGISSQAYLESADVVEIKIIIDKLVRDYGPSSQQVADVFEILIKRYDQDVAQIDQSNFDYFGWSLALPNMYHYNIEVLQNDMGALNLLASFLEKWEHQTLVTSDQTMFDRMPEVFAAQTSFDDIDALILNDQALDVDKQGGRFISRIYLMYARHLNLFELDENAGPYIYKALFNLPKESRLEWEEILLLYDELESYHLYENKNDKLSNYLSLKVIETAEQKMLRAVEADQLRRFETLDDIRQTIVNSIFNLRFLLLSEKDYEQSAKLKNVIYNAIQLLRLNRITFMYNADDVDRKNEVAQMQTSERIAKAVIDNNVRYHSNELNKTPLGIKLRSLDSYQLWIPEDTAIIVAYDGWFDTNFAFIDRLNFDPLFSQIDRDELKALVEKILDSVRYDTVSNTLPEFDFESSDQLYKELFGSSYAQMMMEDKKNIIFMPSKSLYNFPLTLLSNGGRLITSYDEIMTYDPQSFIIDKYNISHLIEITDELIEDTFVEQLSTSPRRSGIQSKTFLGVANPYFGKAKTAALRGLNFVALDEFEEIHVEFSSLPETINEVKAASKIFDPQNSKILEGTRATKSNFLGENLIDYDVIMFSTHGLTPGEISGFEDSALVLAKDPNISGEIEFSEMLLSSNDIIKTSLDADLVMMNACSTGISNTKSAPGLTGLAQSFLAAGAQSVMVSHWNVASEQTVELTESMFETLANNPNLSYAGALQEAQVKIKNQAATQHPFYWAPFTIYNNFN